MIWRNVRRFALLLALWTVLALLRGPACPWDWGMALEAGVIVTVAWFVSAGIAVKLLQSREGPAPWEAVRRLNRVSLGVAVELVVVSGLVGVALCRARA